jgi:hypothetical protein
MVTVNTSITKDRLTRENHYSVKVLHDTRAFQNEEPKTLEKFSIAMLKFDIE